jgi:hypothetical protein
MREIPEINVADTFLGRVKHMPEMKDIPQEFKHGRTKWNILFNQMFFNGVKELRLAPKTGVDTQKAMAAIRAIMASFEPKHEHKEAACAYLFSEWFTDYSIKTS